MIAGWGTLAAGLVLGIIVDRLVIAWRRHNEDAYQRWLTERDGPR